MPAAVAAYQLVPVTLRLLTRAVMSDSGSATCVVLVVVTILWVLGLRFFVVVVFVTMAMILPAGPHGPLPDHRARPWFVPASTSPLGSTATLKTSRPASPM